MKIGKKWYINVFFCILKMSNQVRGSKRLKIIQNYLNGREDPEYEVFPTKTENKYIVRKRKEPLQEQSKPIDENHKEIHTDETNDEPIEEPKPEKRPKAPVYDPTINLEILNQLKLLGEEIKQKREKKEQKQMIKNVVQKQILKHPRYHYAQPQYIQTPNEQGDDEDYDEEPIQPPPQQMLRRRNNIFQDMY